MDGSKPFFPHTDHEGTSNSRRNSGNDINMSHHMGDNDFGAHYAAMIQNGQYPHPYDPYSTHTIIGQSGLPLSIPFGLLQYAQFQEDTRLAKNKGLRRGKWTVRRLSQCSFIHMNCSCYFFSYVVFIVMMMLFWNRMKKYDIPIKSLKHSMLVRWYYLMKPRGPRYDRICLTSWDVIQCVLPRNIPVLLV